MAVCRINELQQQLDVAHESIEKTQNTYNCSFATNYANEAQKNCHRKPRYHSQSGRSAPSRHAPVKKSKANSEKASKQERESTRLVLQEIEI